MESRILGVYKITYPGYGMSHVKNLISHEDYEQTYKMWNSRKQELEAELADLNKKKHMDSAWLNPKHWKWEISSQAPNRRRFNDYDASQ
jgi:hypothetical protein